MTFRLRGCHVKIIKFAGIPKNETIMDNEAIAKNRIFLIVELKCEN